MIRSGNPVLRQFARAQTWSDVSAPAATARPNTMTVMGTVHKSLMLMGLCAIAAISSFGFVSNPAQASLGIPLAIGGLVLGFILYFVIHFAPRTAPFLALPYAACEGAFLGLLSYVVAAKVAGTGGAATGVGIVFQALLLTFGIAIAMLLAYCFRVIRIGSTARKVMVAAALGVMFSYAAGFILQLVGVPVPLMHDLFGFGKTGLIGIGFSVAMIILASLFLVLDFQFIEEGANAGAPKYMEWVGAFGLLVTIVWIYIEVLRLLAKLRSSD